MELTQDQVGKLIPAIKTVMKEKGTPSQLRALAAQVLAALEGRTTSGAEKWEAVQPLVAEINSFIAKYAMERPTQRSFIWEWPPRGALPVPHDSPWISKRKRSGQR